MTPCILHTGKPDKDGYGKVKVHGKTWKAHRLAYTRQVGPIPEGLVLMHSCDNRMCINPEHLTPGTHQENLADRDAKGRQAKGTRHGRSKLTKEDVVAIRESSLTQQAIAAQYGVSQASISDIIRRVTWED